MSGSVAEALLATGSKKVPLLPPPPKLKKEPKTFRFNLKLPESNDESYPEFSWTELVRNAKQKELKKKADKGTPVLDPFASDDEEDLKAMAAKFEAKYNTSSCPTKKKKKRREDFIDKGAGYDDNDPFIDNSDVYDEVVPPDLQTQHGGFYINSGSLDFKEVELSEDDEDSISQGPKVVKVEKDKQKDRLTPTGTPTVAPAIQTNSLPTPIPMIKRKVGRPPGMLNKSPLLKDKAKLIKIKKRKLIVTPVGPDGKTIIKSYKNPSFPSANSNKPDDDVDDIVQNVKSSKTLQISSSSSSSSGSSSSEDSSSTSGSESTSTEDTGVKKEKLKEVKSSAPPKLKPAFVAPKAALDTARITITSTSLPSATQNPPPQKRLKTKNVPLNPKLHPNLSTASVSSTPPPPPILSASNNIQQQQLKVLNKDLIKASTNGGGNLSSSPRVQSPLLGAPVVTTSPAAIRVPTPKSISTPSPSGSGSITTGLTISSVTPHLPKPVGSSGISAKHKAKSKQPSNTTPLTHMDVFQTLSNYTGLPNLPNLSFSPAIVSSPSLMKSGMNMSLNPHKSMPNLKKLPQSADKTERLLHKHLKSTGQKVIKTKSKPQPGNMPVPSPTSNSTSSPSGNNASLNSYLSSLTGPYKTPPPLAGPGVEAAKHRTPTSQATSANTKTSSVPRSFAPSQLTSTAVSMALSTANLLNSNSFVNSGYSSVISSSANALLANSIPSSLTVQRLSQSVTITPSSHTPFPGSVERPSMSNSKGSSAAQYSIGVTDIKPVKHNSSYDVSSLLQNSGINFSGASVITMANSSSSSKLAKITSSMDRELLPKKQ